ncbi:hypothetical protein ACIQ1D_16890 [Lysinibacillus xylanilyticus]|uniref:hypothetical protein n=1 Tax=Lysinibacillus xylanilyticus TaxID=582475 RepID=UPI0037F96A2D
MLLSSLASVFVAKAKRQLKVFSNVSVAAVTNVFSNVSATSVIEDSEDGEIFVGVLK